MLVLTRLPGTETDLSLSIRDIVLALAKVWARELKRKPLPRLYSTGVFYKPEPVTLKWDEWTDPYTTNDRGYGDCDDLVIWRLAEILNEHGYTEGDRLPAWPAVARRLNEPLYHVFIHHRSGAYEDPSQKLLKEGEKVR